MVFNINAESRNNNGTQFFQQIASSICWRRRQALHMENKRLGVSKVYQGTQVSFFFVIVSARINSLSIHPSGKLALTLGADRQLRSWDLTRGIRASALQLPKGEF